MKTWIISFHEAGEENKNIFIAKTVVVANDDGDAVEVAKKKLSLEYPKVMTCLWTAIEHDNISA